MLNDCLTSRLFPIADGGRRLVIGSSMTKYVRVQNTVVKTYCRATVPRVVDKIRFGSSVCLDMTEYSFSWEQTILQI